MPSVQRSPCTLELQKHSDVDGLMFTRQFMYHSSLIVVNTLNTRSMLTVDISSLNEQLFGREKFTVISQSASRDDNCEQLSVVRVLNSLWHCSVQTARAVKMLLPSVPNFISSFIHGETTIPQKPQFCYLGSTSCRPIIKFQ
jgi:hypothetical protein